jgi:hypothetical protein
MAKEYNKDLYPQDEIKDSTLLLSQPVLQYQNHTIQVSQNVANSSTAQKQ